MIDFVNNKEDYTKYKSRFAEIFKANTDFENNPFNESFKCFVDFDFDFIYHKSFFKGLKTFVKNINNKSVVFYTIEPSPEDYFHKNFPPLPHESFRVVNSKNSQVVDFGSFLLS